eukprot:jgi/Mesvir1/9827/Mv19662-RA.1
MSYVMEAVCSASNVVSSSATASGKQCSAKPGVAGRRLMGCNRPRQALSSSTSSQSSAGLFVGKSAGNRTRIDTVCAVGGTAGVLGREQGAEAEQPGLSARMKKLFSDYAKGYLNVKSSAETHGWIEVVEGAIPKELTGTLLRNGPAQNERAGMRKPFLDGDGMVSSIAFKDGKAYFRNKFVRTPGFIQEEKAGRFEKLSIFTAEDPRPAITGKPVWWHRLVDDIFRGPPTVKNNGAYNAWYWGGSLVAVDFGSPFALNPRTLDTEKRGDTFSNTKYTAHSRLMTEADGSRRMVNFLPHVDWAKQKSFITFVEFDEDGNKVSEKKYEFPAAYFHDMIVTDNWYILFDCPIKMDYVKTFLKYPTGEVSLGDTISEDRSRPPIFRLFPRRKTGPMVEVPVEGSLMCFAYHHVNGFETPDGNVIFDTCTWDKFSLYFKDITEPDGKATYPRTKFSRFFLDMNAGKARHQLIDRTPCEYPTVAQGVTGKPYRHSFMSATGASEYGINGPMQDLAKVSLVSASADANDLINVRADRTVWCPGPSKFVGEPLFVPREGATSEDDGWVLVLVHDGSDATGPATELAVMDGKDITKGPVALLRLPTYVPMGVHGSFTEEYILGPQ